MSIRWSCLRSRTRGKARSRGRGDGLEQYRLKHLARRQSPPEQRTLPGAFTVQLDIVCRTLGRRGEPPMFCQPAGRLSAPTARALTARPNDRTARQLLFRTSLRVSTCPFWLCFATLSVTEYIHFSAGCNHLGIHRRIRQASLPAFSAPLREHSKSTRAKASWRTGADDEPDDIEGMAAPGLLAFTPPVCSIRFRRSALRAPPPCRRRPSL